MSNRKYRALSVAALLALSMPGRAAEMRRVPWDNLSMVTGHTVRVFMPGVVLTGKATAVEANALVLDVKKTSDRNAYSKGVLRVPRESLRTLEMQTKGKGFRVIFTLLGSWLGLGGGVAVSQFAIEQCSIFGGCRGGHPVAAGFALAGITVAGGAGGYFAGNALDKHWITIEIVQ